MILTIEFQKIKFHRHKRNKHEYLITVTTYVRIFNKSIYGEVVNNI